jgi:hypothetical protein
VAENFNKLAEYIYRLLMKNKSTLAKDKTYLQMMTAESKRIKKAGRG